MTTFKFIWLSYAQDPGPDNNQVQKNKNQANAVAKQQQGASAEKSSAKQIKTKQKTLESA